MQTEHMGIDFCAQAHPRGNDMWMQTNAPATSTDGATQTYVEIQTQTQSFPVTIETQTEWEEVDQGPDVSIAFSALDETGQRQHIKFESSIDPLQQSMDASRMMNQTGGTVLNFGQDCALEGVIQ
jgi:hypothetical protein